MSFSHTFESGWAFSVVEWGMGAEDGLLEIAIKKALGVILQKKR